MQNVKTELNPENTQEYKYEAFISYRHLAPDNMIAQKLHTAIETYRIPSYIREKTGKLKMGRVFRDEEELPLSSDLGADIHQALVDSKWLIVICSPRLLLSKWCLKEIDTFIELGKKDNILALIIEAEPVDSFPEQLRYFEENGIRIEREPLAADVRGDTQAEMLKKLKAQKLKLLAPMLGVEYDELKQRAKERKLKIVAALSLCATLLIGAFTAYALIQSNKIKNERNNALTNQSMYLADMSKRVHKDGDRITAIMLALEALPDNAENPDRPYVYEAEVALRNALLSTENLLYTPVTTVHIKVDSYRADTRYLAVFNKDIEGYLRYYDISTGADVTNKLIPDASIFDFTPIACRFDKNLNPVFYGRDDIYIYKLNASSYETVEIAWGNFYRLSLDYQLVQAENTMVFYNNESNKINMQYMYYNYNTIVIDDANKVQDVCELPAFNDTILVALAVPKDNASTLRTYHTTYGNFEKEFFSNDIDEQGNVTQEFYYRGCDASYDEKTVLGCGLYRIDIFDVDTTKLTASVDAMPAQLEMAAFSPTDEMMAFLTSVGDIYVYDYVNKKIIVQLDTGLASISSFQWSNDGEKILAVCDDNCARLYNTANGALMQTLKADGEVESATFACYSEKHAYGANDLRILLAGDDFITVYEAGWGQDFTSPLSVKLSGVNDTGCDTAAFSPQSKTLAVTAGNTILMYDTKTGALKGSAETFLLSLLPINEDCFAVYRDRIYSQTKGVEVYSAADASLIKSIEFKFTDRINTKRQTWENIDVTEVNEDLSLFLVGTNEGCTFVYDTKTWEKLWGCEVYDPTDINACPAEVKEQATDSGVEISTRSHFISKDKVLVYYSYYSSGYINYTDFEIRDARTGEVLSEYTLKQGFCTAEVDNGVVSYIQDDDKSRHTVDIFTGEEIIPAKEALSVNKNYLFDGKELTLKKGVLTDIVTGDEYISLGSAEDYIKISAVSPDGKNLVYYNTTEGGLPKLLHTPELSELIETANKLLNGREFTDEEREKYFINVLD